MPLVTPTIGLILAGGQSRRMGGGDKCLRLFAGRPLLSRVIERARIQVDALVLNANGDPSRFGEFDLPVITDPVSGFVGPLAGVLAGLEWAAASMPAARHVISFAADAPFFPTDLVSRLLQAVDETGSDLACASSGGQVHPVFGLWRVDLRHELCKALVDERIYKVDRWTSRYKLVEVDFPTAPVDPFFNANRPEDFAEAERFLR